MNRLKHKKYKLKNFFLEEIWNLEMEELSKAKARFVKYVKVLIITLKTFAQQKIGPQAVALSYFSVMAVVPIMALIFAVTGGLGFADRLKELVYSYFTGGTGQQVVDIVMQLAQNIIDTAQSGWLGLFNALL